MLELRFKILVIRLLTSLLDIQVRRMIVIPRHHPWSDVMEEAEEFLKQAHSLSQVSEAVPAPAPSPEPVVEEETQGDDNSDA